MAREWTDEEVRAEIAEAVRIVREDQEKATYKSLHEKYGEKAEPPDGKKGGKEPPPPKEDGGEPDKPKGKRSLWWGDRLNEESE